MHVADVALLSNGVGCCCANADTVSNQIPSAATTNRIRSTPLPSCFSALPSLKLANSAEPGVLHNATYIGTAITKHRFVPTRGYKCRARAPLPRWRRPVPAKLFADGRAL